MEFINEIFGYRKSSFERWVGAMWSSKSKFDKMGGFEQEGPDLGCDKQKQRFLQHYANVIVD